MYLGVSFSSSQGVVTTPLGKTCYKKGLVRRGLKVMANLVKTLRICFAWLRRNLPWSELAVTYSSKKIAISQEVSIYVHVIGVPGKTHLRHLCYNNDLICGTGNFVKCHINCLYLSNKFSTCMSIYELYFITHSSKPLDNSIPFVMQVHYM